MVHRLSGLVFGFDQTCFDEPTVLYWHSHRVAGEHSTALTTNKPDILFSIWWKPNG